MQRHRAGPATAKVGLPGCLCAGGFVRAQTHAPRSRDKRRAPNKDREGSSKGRWWESVCGEHLRLQKSCVPTRSASDQPGTGLGGCPRLKVSPPQTGLQVKPPLPPGRSSQPSVLGTWACGLAAGRRRNVFRDRGFVNLGFFLETGFVISAQTQ